MINDYIYGGSFNVKRLLHNANVLDIPIKLTEVIIVI